MSGGFRLRDRAADRLVPRRAGEQTPLAAVTAILTFLAALALALGLAGGRLVENWGGKLAGTATLQIVAEGAVVEQEARPVAGPVAVRHAPVVDPDCLAAAPQIPPPQSTSVSMPSMVLLVQRQLLAPSQTSAPHSLSGSVPAG